MDASLFKKFQKLNVILNDMQKICIAFSGGVDSTLLLKIARDALGMNNVLAITAVSNTYTRTEKETASRMAAFIDVLHFFLPTDEVADQEYASNPPDRCYHCKKHFYETLLPVARSKGFELICDGSNLDDLADYRPGKKAGEELGVRSPLIEAGMAKADVRALSRELGLPGWDRPANPCLASRIPYGSKITSEKLSVIEKAEKFIHTMGFALVRVRHHELIARIEIPPEDMRRFIEHPQKDELCSYLKGLGFTWVALDIAGYRTGSMNESIETHGL